MEASAVRVLGRAAEPRARSVAYADLIGGAQDSQRIEVTGVVHSARFGKAFDRDTLILGLDLGGAEVTVFLQDFSGMEPAKLVDATIRVRGVCGSDFNDRRQFTGAYVLVPSRRDIEVVQPAAEDPFALKAVPLRSALRFGQALHRIKIVGVVTWQDANHALYLQDGSDGIRILTAVRHLIPLGTRVEAVGFPAMGEYSPVLEEGIFRMVGEGTPTPAMRIDAASVLGRGDAFNTSKADGQLVQIEGTVVDRRVQGMETIITVRQGKEVFEAHLAGAEEGAGLGLSAGSLVRFTGVCSVRTDAYRSPTSLVILLRSEADVVVLKKMSWWTPLHTVSVVCGVGEAVLIVALWMVILRHRVEDQTRTIRESEGRFRTLAHHDVLTGLPNRLMLEERIVQCLRDCERTKHFGAVFTIDIDRFKQINDTYGHLTGDECLKIVAARLRGAVRHTDTIARTGGEEFTLVACSLSNREGAAAIANQILSLFRDPVVVLGNEIAVTVSAGCALFPEDGLEAEALRRRSDQALYEAKRTGRNRIVFATDELSAALEQAAGIEVALRDALRLDSFKLAYQPIYDGAGKIRRLEALLRTTDERLSKLGPSAYIPIAESCGLILPIGRWVLQEACRQTTAWQAAGLEVCPVAVNISAAQIQQTNFAEEVLRVLQSFDLEPCLLELELTETCVMTELSTVAEKITRLADAGVTFAIDDFGTGYSSLSRLHELPIEALKIDRSFVDGLEPNSGTCTIIKAVIQIARSLKLQVVAEGIELPEQLDLLRDLGCDLFQGYLMARPLSAEAIAAMLGENRRSVQTVAAACIGEGRLATLAV